MKICYISNSDIHTEKLTSWFSQKGNDVHLITSDLQNIDGITNHHIHHDNDQPINFIRNIIKTRKLVKKIKPDILHANYAFGYGTFGAFANFHPFILSPWGSDVLIDSEKSKIKRIFIKYALKNSDLITSDGENIIEKVLDMGLFENKIHLIYCGVDVEKFNYKKYDKIKKTNPVIISTRNFDKLYDIETIIKSVPYVLKKFPNAQFLIAGKELDKEYGKKIKNLVKYLGISKNIKFIGHINYNKIPYYLSLSDIYVSASLSDGGISLSTLEAMACETTCIITDVANNKQWIHNGENGFIIPIKRHDILSEKIIYLLENEDIRKKFGKISRKIVVKKQNYEKQMEKLENLYLNLLKR